MSSSRSIPLATECRRFGSTKRVIEEINDMAVRLLGNSYVSITVRRIDCALLGDMKAGKSSLGNALLGQLVFPVSFGPCTSRPTIVTSGPTRTCVMVTKSGHRETRQWNEGETLPSDTVAVESTAERTAADQYDYVDVTVSDCPFLQHGICLVDLPGLNETEQMDEKVLRRLRDIALTIFVMDSGPGLTGSGRNTLQRLIEHCVNVQAPILFVANKVDQLTSGGLGGPSAAQARIQREKTLEALYQKLRAIVPALDPFLDRETSLYWSAVSAKEAGDSYLTGSPLPPAFVAFQDKLFSLLRERLVSAITEASAGIWNGLNAWALLCSDMRAAQIAKDACLALQHKMADKKELDSMEKRISFAIRDSAAEILTKTRADIVRLAEAFELLQVDIADSRSHETAAKEQLRAFVMSTFNERLNAAFSSFWVVFINDVIGMHVGGLSSVRDSNITATFGAIAASVCADVIRANSIRTRAVTTVGPLTSWLFSFFGRSRADFGPAWKRKVASQILDKLDSERLGETLGSDIMKEFSHRVFDALVDQSKKLYEKSAALLSKGGKDAQQLLRQVATLALQSRAAANEYLFTPPRVAPGADLRPSWAEVVIPVVWKGADLVARVIPPGSDGLFSDTAVRLYDAKTVFDEGFDITQTSPLDGPPTFFIITAPGRMPTLSKLRKRMQSTKIEPCPPQGPAAVATERGSVPSLLEAIGAISSGGARPGEPEYGTWQTFSTALSSKAKDFMRIAEVEVLPSFAKRSPVTVDEAAALMLLLTDEVRAFVDRRLCDTGKTRSVTSLLPFLSLIQSACGKLGQQPGEYFVWINPLPPDFESRFAPGERQLICNGFISASSSRQVVNSFAAVPEALAAAPAPAPSATPTPAPAPSATPGLLPAQITPIPPVPQGALVRITRATAVDVSMFSVCHAEREMLFLPGARFLSKSLRNDPTRIREVELELATATMRWLPAPPTRQAPRPLSVRKT